MSNQFSKDDLKRLGLMECSDGVYRKIPKRDPYEVIEEIKSHGTIRYEHKDQPFYCIEMVPQACPRPRVNKDGHAFMPSKYRIYKKALVSAIEGLNIPSVEYKEIEAVFYFEFPKSVAKKNRVEGAIKITKPDCDNLLKGICDALETARVIDNDSRFFHMSSRKHYTVNNPRIEFKLKI